jgi:nicotinamide-nucleotide amidase
MQNNELMLIVEKLAKLFIQNNKKLTIAESCTGGWVAKVLTDLAGSSVWFERGFVTYSNQAKNEMLGVTESILETYGAVSQETVTEMALGALKNSHADYSLSISGIAGPDGGSAEKPVGLVWFGWANKKNNSPEIITSEQKIFSGDRNAIREQAVTYALSGLIQKF